MKSADHLQKGWTVFGEAVSIYLLWLASASAVVQDSRQLWRMHRSVSYECESFDMLLPVKYVHSVPIYMSTATQTVIAKAGSECRCESLAKDP